VRKIVFVLSVFFLLSCSSDETVEEIQETVVLANLLVDREVVIDNVIACAASNRDPNVVSVYLYPRPGVTNIRIFGTENITQDKNDFNNYTEINSPPLEDFLNGYLLRYEVRPTQEKWVVAIFEENDEIHIANPVRLKQITAPTEYLTDNVSIDNIMGNMPGFEWTDGSFTDSVIYFHAVTEEDGELLSGTYTFEQNFQYYKLDNVVLNITEETPPDLDFNTPYNFVLLGVTEDSWVNLISEIPFEL